MLEDLASVKCSKQVRKELPGCEHSAMVACHQDPATVHCFEPCGGTLQCCSRTCKAFCSVCQAQTTQHNGVVAGRLSRTHHVGHPCERLLYCQHKCGRDCAKEHQCNTECRQTCRQRCAHHKCLEPCFKPCAPCMKECEWSCPHFTCPVLCGSVCPPSSLLYAFSLLFRLDLFSPSLRRAMHEIVEVWSPLPLRYEARINWLFSGG